MPCYQGVLLVLFRLADHRGIPRWLKNRTIYLIYGQKTEILNGNKIIIFYEKPSNIKIRRYNVFHKT
jgi:hypothetical protein